MQRARFGAFHQSAPVFDVTQVHQCVLQPDTIIVCLTQILRFQHNIRKIIQQDHAGFFDRAGQLRVELLFGAVRVQLVIDRRQQGRGLVDDFRFRLRQGGRVVPVNA
ncbi:hypothetical protein D3C79_971880 [compost metagenome]